MIRDVKILSKNNYLDKVASFRASTGTRSQLNNEELLRLFAPVEGQVSFYYGRIRNGKTYAATADILDLLKRGEVVYANWFVDFKDFDERSNFWIVFVKTMFGKKRFYKYKKENFHYFHPDDIDIAFLGRLVNAHIFIDEGQWIFNSHVRNPDVEKRKLILHNGHYSRSLNIISQRPNNVFIDMRSQVNVWYKCEKLFSLPFLTLFMRSEFQDMKDDMPDEEKPSSVKHYFLSKEVANAYSTHAMRGDDALEEKVDFEVYSLSFFDKIKLLFSFTPLGLLFRAKPGRGGSGDKVVDKKGSHLIISTLKEKNTQEYDPQVHKVRSVGKFN